MKTVIKTVPEASADDTDTASTTTPAADDDSCNAKGINPEKGKEGTCTDDKGRTFTVTDKRVSSNWRS